MQIKNLTHLTHICKFFDTQNKLDMWYIFAYLLFVTLIKMKSV